MFFDLDFLVPSLGMIICGILLLIVPNPPKIPLIVPIIFIIVFIFAIIISLMLKSNIFFPILFGFAIIPMAKISIQLLKKEQEEQENQK